jgi:hypothetical protein
VDLQKAPFGLLELFRLKSGGVGPTQFGDAVIPTVEVGELYGAEQLCCNVSQSAAAAMPITVTETIGANAGNKGPIRLHGVGAHCTIGAAAGTWAQLSVLIQMPAQGGTPVVYCPLASLQFTPRIGQSFYLGIPPLPRPLMIRNGIQLLAQLTGDAVGADHVVALHWLYEWLPQAQP